MKNLKLFSILTLSLLSSSLYAQTDKEAEELYRVVDEAGSLKSDLSKVGKVEKPCVSCGEVEIKKRYSLDKEEFNIDTPYYIKENDPYVIQVKRHANSPKKIKMNFKNGQKICARYVSYTNPLNGSLGMDCLFHTTQYEMESFDLDFSKMPPLKAGETETYEIRMAKPNVDKMPYSVDIHDSNEAKMKVQIKTDKKFWSSGYKVNFKK